MQLSSLLPKAGIFLGTATAMLTAALPTEAQIIGCFIDSAGFTPGSITNTSSSDTLSTVTPSLVTYLCSENTKVSVSSPQQTNIALAGEEVTGTLNSSISDVTNNGVSLGITASTDDEVTIPAGTNVVAVSMEAIDNDGVIRAGNYMFGVSMTITCL